MMNVATTNINCDMKTAKTSAKLPLAASPLRKKGKRAPIRHQQNAKQNHSSTSKNGSSSAPFQFALFGRSDSVVSQHGASGLLSRSGTELLPNFSQDSAGGDALICSQQSYICEDADGQLSQCSEQFMDRLGLLNMCCSQQSQLSHAADTNSRDCYFSSSGVGGAAEKENEGNSQMSLFDITIPSWQRQYSDSDPSSISSYGSGWHASHLTGVKRAMSISEDPAAPSGAIPPLPQPQRPLPTPLMQPQRVMKSQPQPHSKVASAVMETERQIDVLPPLRNLFLAGTQPLQEAYFDGDEFFAHHVRTLSSNTCSSSVPQRPPPSKPRPHKIFIGAFKQRPRIVTEFEELQVLGRGQFSTVLCVRHRLDGTLYAVKRVSEGIHSQHTGRVQLREAAALAALQHQAGGSSLVRTAPAHSQFNFPLLTRSLVIVIHDVVCVTLDCDHL